VPALTGISYTQPIDVHDCASLGISIASTSGAYPVDVFVDGAPGGAFIPLGTVQVNSRAYVPLNTPLYPSVYVGFDNKGINSATILADAWLQCTTFQ
jgi:hypothetical protein